METDVTVKNIKYGNKQIKSRANKSKAIKKRNVFNNSINLILLFIVPVVLIAIWEIGSQTGAINQSILPAPTRVIDALETLINNGKLANNLIVSIERVLKGFLFGAVSGVIIGSIMGLSKTINQILSSLVGILRPIPMIAWIPLLILWMGIDESSKVTVIFIGSFWPILINTIHGIQTVDIKLLEVASILEKSKMQVLFKVILPSALPSIFTGLRLGMGSAWTCVVAAEMIAASRGIGYMITYARELSQPDVMLVGVFAIGIIGLLIDTVIIGIQKSVLRWSIDTK